MPRPTAPPSQSQGAVQAFGEAPVHFSFQICRADEGVRLGQSLQQYALKLTNLIMQ